MQPRRMSMVLQGDTRMLLSLCVCVWFMSKMFLKIILNSCILIRTPKGFLYVQQRNGIQSPAPSARTHKAMCFTPGSPAVVDLLYTARLN